jgi:hypothetical protein
LQELIAPLLDKSVNLINGEKFSTLSDGEGWLYKVLGLMEPGGGGRDGSAKPPRENNSEHLREASSKLKFPAFPSSSNYSSQACQWAGGIDHCSYISSSWDHFREPTYPSNLDLTTSPRETSASTFWVDTLQTCPVERSTTNCHPVQHIYLRRGRDPEKPPI